LAFMRAMAAGILYSIVLNVFCSNTSQDPVSSLMRTPKLFFIYSINKKVSSYHCIRHIMATGPGDASLTLTHKVKSPKFLRFKNGFFSARLYLPVYELD